MSKILVCGVVNFETTLLVEEFPLKYEQSVHYPFWGVQSQVSGVGFNVATAMATLGASVTMTSFSAQDELSYLVKLALDTNNIDAGYVLPWLPQTPQSVVIYDREGKRQVHTDLKDLKKRKYPQPMFRQAIKDCDLAVMNNVDFARPLLKIARQKGIPIATDVHVLKDLDDTYNKEFLQAADILFLSGEKLPTTPEKWALEIQKKFDTAIVVIAMGKEGSLLAEKESGLRVRVEARSVRPVVNTVGAGDALFSAFNYFYLKSGDAQLSLRKASIFAGHKIGESGGTKGFLTEKSLNDLFVHDDTDSDVTSDNL